MWSKLVVIVICVAIITASLLWWREKNPAERNYLGEVIQPELLSNEPIPTRWWALIETAAQGTGAAGVYLTQAACRDDFNIFQSKMRQAHQESILATMKFDCVEQPAGATMSGLLKEFIAQIDDLLTQQALAHDRSEQISPSPLPWQFHETPAPTPLGRWKWVIIATSRQSSERFSFADLPWFDEETQCQTKLAALLNHELAELGQQTLKDNHDFTCERRFWNSN
jgi:hypothetical protein